MARERSNTLVVNGRFLTVPQTGLQRVARTLLDIVRARGFAVEVVAPSAADGVDRVVASPPGRAGSLVWEQTVLPALARGRPVVSLANTAPVVVRRSLVVVHDLATLVHPEWFRRDMRLYGHLSVIAARGADVVVTVSHQVRDELVARGVATDRITVVRNAVDPNIRAAGDDDVARVRARFGLDGPFVLHLGWADPRKDAALLARAHLQAAASSPHTLVLVGTPRPNFAPVAIADAPSIRRLTGVDDDDVRALLTGAAALAFPSRYEGFGLPPIEAIACGTPAIVADTPALREATEDNATVLPVGDVDAWARALADAVTGRLPPPGPPPAWTWDDAADVLVTALERLLR